MRYVPFTKIEQVEKYYCRYINHNQYGIMNVIGCKKTRSGDYVEIYCIDECGNEKCIRSDDILNNATYMNHPFGEIENEEI